MKLNVRGHWYDANKEPVLIELTKEDRVNIQNMHWHASHYLSYPDWYELQGAKEWLKFNPPVHPELMRNTGIGSLKPLPIDITDEQARFLQDAKDNWFTTQGWKTDEIDADDIEGIAVLYGKFLLDAQSVRIGKESVFVFFSVIVAAICIALMLLQVKFGI